MPISFVLIPGAGGSAWYWHRVVPLLEKAGHAAVAVNLPGDDEHAGLDAYADRVVRENEGRRNVIVVAQSMGGFTALMACARSTVNGLVFVNAMIPMPGETPGDWWGNTGSTEARVAAAKRHGYNAEFDLDTYFLHDVAREIAEAGAAHQRREAAIAFGDACRFERFPDVPIRVIAGRDDRFFPLEFQQRVARERLGKGVDSIPGGHLVALSHPHELADQLLRR